MTKKLIIHIPHSADSIPNRTGYIVRDTDLMNEMLLLTDWYTNDLFSSAENIEIIADFNRLFCDVERFSDDSKEVMSEVGMGFTYTKLDSGKDLRVVSDELKTRILNEYYYPHHNKLSTAVNEQLISTGETLIIDCHSFSDTPFKRDINQQTPRPDICIGTDDFHTPRFLIEFSVNFFKQYDLSVEVNMPYSGSIVPMAYYQQDNRVASIMVEINRSLYLVNGTNVKGEGYEKIKSVIQTYLDEVSKLDFHGNFK
jgi:N-formylglutamate deformylase